MNTATDETSWERPNVAGPIPDFDEGTAAAADGGGGGGGGGGVRMARALFDFKSEAFDELDFQQGDIITIYSQDGDTPLPLRPPTPPA